VTLPQNAQESTIYYLHSHYRSQTTVKLHITVFNEVTEYKTLNIQIFTAYALCNSNLFTALKKHPYLQQVIIHSPKGLLGTPY